jgi:hypothetical protein
MKTPVKQKAGLKAKAKEIVANTNKSVASKVMAGIAAKVAAKKEAKAAATTPAPMQKYGASKGKPAAKMKKC